MQNLTDLSTIRGLFERHGFQFSKTLGQNFLINPSVCPRIAELGGADSGTGVIEIGTGVGVLTVELAKRAKKVVAIEIDSRLLPILDETLAEFDNVKVINAEDVPMRTKLNFRNAEFEPQGKRITLWANSKYEENTFEERNRIMPVEDIFNNVSSSMDVTFRPQSMTVLRFKLKK